MIVGAEEAGRYFNRTVPDWMEYHARDGVCLAFHLSHAEDVWMVHAAAQRAAYGKTTSPAVRLLHEFWQKRRPAHIIGWIDADNRAAAAFAKRCGCKLEGTMASGIEMYGWRPEWAL